MSIRAIRDLESGRARSPRRETIRLLAAGLRISDVHRVVLEAAAKHGVELSADQAITDGTTFAPPAPINAMVGRQAELQALSALMTSRAERMVAVIGFGGVGKTRLVLELAQELYSRHGFSVLWIPNATPDHGDSVARRTMELIRTRVRDLATNESGDIRMLAKLIGDRETLIVLDGCNGTVLRSSGLVNLLQHCPRLRIVVTARSPRTAPGVHLFPLAPLPVPALDQRFDQVSHGQFDSVRLLRKHIGRSQPGFRLDAATWPVLSSICRCLDGLPAALETVGQWMLIQTPSQLLEQLVEDPLMVAASSHDPREEFDPTRAVKEALGELDSSTVRLLFATVELEDRWSAQAAATAIGQTPVELARAIQALLLYGLIRRVDESSGARFQTLNVVRRVMGALSTGRASEP